MGGTEKEEIIKREISRKIKKLAELEEKQAINGLSAVDNEFKISRKVFACIDGFIILRTFSKTHLDSFELFISPLRIGWVVKNQLPIKTKDGQILSLFKLINLAIRINWGIGTKLDIGSQGGGIKINNFEIDGFQIMILSYKEIEQFKDTIDDIDFIIYSNSEIQKLTEENNELRFTINELNIINEPLILTEGKTDWKHFVSALRYFHSKNQFMEIQEKWFLKFGSKDDVTNKTCDTTFEFENSVSKLNKLLDSYIEARTIDKSIVPPIRIGIFDSDEKQAKSIIDKENKVYSFLIEPNEISTEFLYSEDEIKSSVDGKRLYIGNEFNSKTKRLINNSTINLGGDNSILNKAGKNVIIDCDVYDEEGNNIALSKEKFAQEIYYDRIKISENSLNNFKIIFDKILEFTSPTRSDLQSVL
jgi:hypothetical protein